MADDRGCQYDAEERGVDIQNMCGCTDGEESFCQLQDEDDGSGFSAGQFECVKDSRIVVAGGLSDVDSA